MNAPNNILPTTLDEWYKAHDCDHAHCPHDCEHPQPFIHEGKLYCGRCYFQCRYTLSEMIPCVPGENVCD